MSVLSVTIRALYQNQWGVSREYVDFFAWTFDRSEQSHVGIDNLRRVWYNESVKIGCYKPSYTLRREDGTLPTCLHNRLPRRDFS
jgi:hypothetical protein